MLVITRKSSESVTCKLPEGVDIEITMIKVNGKRAILGITAPNGVTIIRNELIIQQ